VPGSSVNTVSGYELDDQAIGVRSPAQAKGGPFPEAKARPGRDADHSPPSSAEVENEQEL
jgi:hypothetical protein